MSVESKKFIFFVARLVHGERSVNEAITLTYDTEPCRFFALFFFG